MTHIDVTGVPECTSCGACCFSQTPQYLRVFGHDYERLDDDAERLVHFIGNRAFLRLADGHCTALTVDPASARFSCSIYGRRPDVCRSIERGSGHCAAERAKKSDQALMMLRKSRGATPC